MDRIDFPMTSCGLLAAAEVAAASNGILCNASESCPENPSGLTAEEHDLLESAETYAHARDQRAAQAAAAKALRSVVA